MNPIHCAGGLADVIGLSDCADRLAGDGELMRQMKPSLFRHRQTLQAMSPSR
jgi:hypothetical protein